jgi:hypothetical protein
MRNKGVGKMAVVGFVQNQVQTNYYTILMSVMRTELFGVLPRFELEGRWM